MRKQEIIELIGKENWEDFSKWMWGQTVAVYPDGELDYYPWDVKAFKTKLDSGYDRQADPKAWD